MANWKEPKSDYKSEDQVLPEIFNILAENEKHLKELLCKVELTKTTGTSFVINELILDETK